MVRTLGNARLLTIGAVVLACAASSLTAVAAAPIADDQARRPGRLFLIGGNLDENGRLLRTFARMSDRDGDGPMVPRIAVVTAGSYPAQTPEEAADPDGDNSVANGRYYRDLFERFDFDAFVVPIDEAVNYPDDPYVPANADDQQIAAKVRDADAVFFGGGDQMRYLRTMVHCEPAPHEAFTDCTDSVVMAAVRHVYDQGGVISGTSAGLTIQQATPMVTGGDPYLAWRDGASPGYYEDDRLAYVPHGGFGFFSAGLLDSHFSTWGREVRMVRLAKDSGVNATVGYGADETTAMKVIDGHDHARVVGRHGVSVIDVSKAIPGSGGDSVRRVRWSYATDGDRIDLTNGHVVRGKNTETVVGSGPGPEPINDVWDTVKDDNIYSMRNLAVALVKSAADRATGITYEHRPYYRTTLITHDNTRAWSSTEHRVSFRNVHFRVKECTNCAPAS